MNNLKLKSFIFIFLRSVPFFFNYGSISYLFIIFNLIGEYELSVHLSILQSIMFFFTAAFSGEFRSVILGSKKYYKQLLHYRIIAAFGFLIFFIFTIPFMEKGYFIILFMLVIRKILDWIEEILLTKTNSTSSNLIYCIIQLIFLIPFPFLFIYFKSWAYIFLVLWIFSTLIFYLNEYKIIFNNYLSETLLKINYFNNKFKIHKQIYATIFIALGNYALRYSIFKNTDLSSASSMISSFSIGGFTGSLISNIFIPNIVLMYKKYSITKKIIEKYVIFIGITIFFILYFNLGRNFLESINLNFYILLASFLGGNILLLVNFKRHNLIQVKKVSTEKEDFLINLFLLIFIFILFRQLNHYYEYITLITSLFAYFIYSFTTSIVLKNKGTVTICVIFYLFVLMSLPILFFVWFFNAKS